jgi:hypothetical protein
MLKLQKISLSYRIMFGAWIFVTVGTWALSMVELMTFWRLRGREIYAAWDGSFLVGES